MASCGAVVSKTTSESLLSSAVLTARFGEIPYDVGLVEPLPTLVLKTTNTSVLLIAVALFT